MLEGGRIWIGLACDPHALSNAWNPSSTRTCGSIFWICRSVSAFSLCVQEYLVSNDQWYERFSFASLVYLLHIVLMFVYMTFSQVVRLLSLRRLENKAMFKDLAIVWNQMQSKCLLLLFFFFLPRPYSTFSTYNLCSCFSAYTNG